MTGLLHAVKKRTVDERCPTAAASLSLRSEGAVVVVVVAVAAAVVAAFFTKLSGTCSCPLTSAFDRVT